MRGLVHPPGVTQVDSELGQPPARLLFPSSHFCALFANVIRQANPRTGGEIQSTSLVKFRVPLFYVGTMI